MLTKLKDDERLHFFITDYRQTLLTLSSQNRPTETITLQQLFPESQAFFLEAIENGDIGESSVIQTNWLNPQTKSLEPVLLYIRAASNWSWLVGSFVPIATIEQEIGLNENRMAGRIGDQISKIAAILIVAYAIAVIIALFIYRKIRWHFTLFINHLQHAAHDNHPVEKEKISIKEFDVLAETMNEQLEQRGILQSELERLAQKDPLTDLYNRRRMDELLHLEISRVERNHNQFSLILCDIDHFKPINDSYGHETGDKVIYAVAEVLRASLRRQDFAARWGGEEFLIALPDTGIKQATAVAEKIRLLCANHAVTNGDHCVRFTMTFGVEVFDGEKEIKATIASADEALYLGKQAGRNIVISAKDD